MKNNTIKGIIGLLIIVVLSQLIISTSFYEPPSITNTSTDQNMVCRWNITGNIVELNVSWYNGSTKFRENTLANTTILDVVNPYTHSKGEIWNCTVEAWNGSTLTTSSTLTTIRNAAPEPIIVYNSSDNDIGNATSIYEDTAYTFNVSSTDPDGDILDYGVYSNLAGSSISATTGIFTWTPINSQNGSDMVRFSATDDDGSEPKSSLVWINFTVIPVNDAPTFSNLTDQEATQNSDYLYVIVIDDEESNFPISFIYSTNNSNITIDSNGDGYTANVSFGGNPPTFGDRGNWTVYINITDSLGANTTSSFKVDVIGVNTAPVINVTSTYNGTQGDNLIIYINATDADVDELSFSVNDSLYSITTIETNGTNASAIINLTPTNNSHVLHRYINITVFDGTTYDWQEVFVNLSNINDAPIIYNNSNSENNTLPLINTYMYNLTAYTNVFFSYKVNATDPDILTYMGDSINYTTNNTDFPITLLTGNLNFTKNDSWIGNYSITITVTDLNNTNTTAILNISILNNTAPYFNESWGNLNCSEDVTCSININATDDDGDNITITDNSSLFIINNQTGLISFTPNQTQIGNYSVRVTVTDSKSAYSYQDFNITINNTNDAPVLNTINLPTIVENHPVLYTVTANDQDLDLPSYLQYDNLTFYSFNLTNITLFNISLTGLISFTPNASHVGNHTYNITVNDTYGAQDSIIFNITVLAKSDPPNITQIYPYGTPFSNDTIVLGWYQRNLFTRNTTTLTNVTENTTILFNHSTTDDYTADENLTYYWLIDGVIANETELGSNNHTLTHDFDFFSSGTRNITLRVHDTMYENSSFTWLASITNLNRAPIIYNQPSNITVDQTSTYNDWFSFYDSESKIIDPDDDVNENGIIDSGENTSLTYTITSCSQATLSVTNNDTLKVVPVQVGQCIVYVNATDGTYSVQSNQITIDITNVPEQEEVQVTSGGGGSSTETITIPIPEEVEVPFPLEVIVPNIITIYENQTIVVPIELQNNWDETLYGISLGALFDVANMTYKFETPYYAQLAPEARVNTTLTLWNYRLGENFEVIILANVTDPNSNDTAILFINSIEQSTKGHATRIKVTYARDLLDSNPECQELNEILEQAIDAMDKNDYNKAQLLVDATIEGCKYLVENQKEKNEETPTNWKTFFLFGNQYPTAILIGIALLMITLISIGIFSRVKKQKIKKIEGKKIKY